MSASSLVGASGLCTNDQLVASEAAVLRNLRPDPFVCGRDAICEMVNNSCHVIQFVSAVDFVLKSISTVTAIEFPELIRSASGITVSASQVRSFSAPKLIFIDGDVGFSSESSFYAISLSNVQFGQNVTITGTLNLLVSRLPSLGWNWDFVGSLGGLDIFADEFIPARVISLKMLRNVSRSIRVKSVLLDVPALTYAGGFSLTGSIPSVVFPSLVQVGSTDFFYPVLGITRLQADNISFPALKSIGNRLDIGDLSGFSSKTPTLSFPELAEVGGTPQIGIKSDETTVWSVDFSKLVNICWSIDAVLDAPVGKSVFDASAVYRLEL